MNNMEKIKVEGKKVHAAINIFYDNIYNTLNNIYRDRECSWLPVENFIRDDAVTTYHYLSFLFSDLYDNIPYATIREISIAGKMYMDHLLLQDAIIDNDSYEINQQSLCRANLLSSMIHEEALKMFYKVFDHKSDFWNYLSIYHNEFFKANIKEKYNYYLRISPYSFDDFKKIACGKASFTKITATSLALLSKDIDSIELFEQSIDNLSIAIQLFDDLTDWKKDYETENYSYLLIKIIEEFGLDEEIIAGNRPETTTIGNCLYYSDFIITFLELIDEYCRKSAEVIKPLKSEYWLNYIDKLKHRREHLKNDLVELREKNIETTIK